MIRSTLFSVLFLVSTFTTANDFDILWLQAINFGNFKESCKQHDCKTRPIIGIVQLPLPYIGMFKDDAVYISEQVSVESELWKSIVFHEYVHALQKKVGIDKYDCAGSLQNEIDALMAEDVRAERLNIKELINVNKEQINQLKAFDCAKGS